MVFTGLGSFWRRHRRDGGDILDDSRFDFGRRRDRLGDGEHLPDRTCRQRREDGCPDWNKHADASDDFRDAVIDLPNSVRHGLNLFGRHEFKHGEHRRRRAGAGDDMPPKGIN